MKLNKKNINIIVCSICLFIAIHPVKSIAQLRDSTQGTFAINAHIHYGFLIPHRPSLIGMVTGHTVGAEVDILKTTDGSKDFERSYRYPEIGLSYCLFNLGNEKVLGNAHAVSPFVSLPLTASEKLQFNLRIGAGIGFVQKPFHRYDNFKNNAIGSVLNGTVNFRAEMQYKLAVRSKITLAWGLTHWSNGSAATPNLGINVTTMSLGYQHFFGKRTLLNNDPLPPVNKRYVTSFFVAAFHKELYPAGGEKYFVGTLYGNCARIISHKSSIGLGADVFYNAGTVESLKREGKPYSEADAWRVGVRLGYYLSLSDFKIAIENGFYVYGELNGDTFIYTRLGVQQKISNHIFLCVNLKSHFARADFFEFGIGYEI